MLLTIMGTTGRYIPKFFFAYPGYSMVHPHQDHIVEFGRMGIFEVIERSSQGANLPQDRAQSMTIIASEYH